jgi:SAM-dependent methyltransferase
MATERPSGRAAGRQRLRASPAFVQALAMDGRPYVAKETEPYIQFWLSERERVLLSLFSRRGGLDIAQAETDYLRHTRQTPTPAERARIARAIADMREGGVLIDADADVSRYDRRIVEHYLLHRPFPRDIVRHLVEHGGVGASTRVLDLAGGPGDLAVALAGHSPRVALMELSRGFLAAARKRAAQAGVPLETIHESANRLVFRDDRFDVVTISQALHWLDDILVCRGVERVLSHGGHFFVIHSAFEVPEAHPLAYLFGHDSVLGAKRPRPFPEEAAALATRLERIFGALGTRDVDRVDPTQAPEGSASIVSAGIRLFRQTRSFGPGFARAFLTPQHIALTGMSSEAFWHDLELRCAGATRRSLQGTHDWAVVAFRHGGKRAASIHPPARPTRIACEAPAEP